MTLREQIRTQRPTARIELLGFVPEAQEHLLHDLLSHRVVVEQSAGQTEDRAGVPAIRLRQRFLLIITLALLPIAAVSVFEGIERVRRDEADVRERLIQAARAAAEEEVAFAASLCDHPRDTLIAVRRTFEDGAIREAFRSLHPRGTRKPMRAFSFLEVESEEEPREEVDLLALAQHKPNE